MKGAAILLCHGTQHEGGRHELTELSQLVGSRLDFPLWLGTLEFPGSDLPSVHQLWRQARGMQRLVIQPVLLFSGGHESLDLPWLVRQATETVGCEVGCGASFGTDPKLIGLAVDRVTDHLGPSDGDTDLLFVGRGSSHPVALSQAAAVAAKVAGRTGLHHLVCHAGISQPDVASGLELALERHPRRLLVLPYLLHTGTLLERVRQVAEEVAPKSSVGVAVTTHIGNHPVLVEMLAGRIRSLLEGGSRV